jgi:hypothetical protein
MDASHGDHNRADRIRKWWSKAHIPDPAVMPRATDEGYGEFQSHLWFGMVEPDPYVCHGPSTWTRERKTF